MFDESSRKVQAGVLLDVESQKLLIKILPGLDLYVLSCTSYTCFGASLFDGFSVLFNGYILKTYSQSVNSVWIIKHITVANVTNCFLTFLLL